MDRMGRMRASDECGMMSDELKAAASYSSLIIPHSSFRIHHFFYPVNPVHPC
jgi:hypothetical protein